MTVRPYLPLCWIRTAPEVSEEKGSYASHFYRWNLESLQELSLTSLRFSRFHWHCFAQLPAWRFLLWLSLTWQQMYLTILSAYHRWPKLWHYIYCFVQSGNGNKHRHKHTKVIKDTLIQTIKNPEIPQIPPLVPWDDEQVPNDMLFPGMNFVIFFIRFS